MARKRLLSPRGHSVCSSFYHRVFIQSPSSIPQSPSTRNSTPVTIFWPKKSSLPKHKKSCGQRKTNTRYPHFLPIHSASPGGLQVLSSRHRAVRRSNRRRPWRPKRPGLVSKRSSWVGTPWVAEEPLRFLGVCVVLGCLEYDFRIKYVFSMF